MAPPTLPKAGAAQPGTGATFFEYCAMFTLLKFPPDGKVFSLELSQKVSQQFAKMVKIIRHNRNNSLFPGAANYSIPIRKIPEIKKYHIYNFQQMTSSLLLPEFTAIYV